MEQLLVSGLCSMFVASPADYRTACPQASQAFLVQSGNRDKLKTYEKRQLKKAKRLAPPYVAPLVIIAEFLAKKELGYTFRFSGPVKAITFSATSEPGAKVLVTVREF